jgi:PAS domain S-box-containing protein
MGILKRLSSRFHLALGMSALVVTLLLAALFAGLMPERDSAVRDGRRALAESVGVLATTLLSDEDTTRIEQTLGFLASRNPTLLSIGLRQNDGRLRIQTGRQAHPQNAELNARSIDVMVRVPLLYQGAVWGYAELAFEPIQGEGSFSFHAGSPALLVLVMGATTFIAFYLYLRRMLRHLDPSRVIPGRVRTAFDTLAEGVMVLDPAGRIVLANQAFVDVVGGSNETLVGTLVADLKWSQPTNAAVQEAPWQTLAEGGMARRNLLMYLTGQDGKRRSFMVNGSPVPGANGKSAGMLVSLDDVTALEEQEVELRLARDAADAANQAKSDFLANMSHEIRTPMNAILGFTELLRRGWQHNPQEAQRHLATIQSSGKHLLSLINDILDLSKVESGHLELERTDCPMHEVVAEVVEIMRVKADQSGVALVLEYPHPLPKTMPMDGARLRQIVTNLVGNALKFTAQGRVTVRVFLGPATETARLHIDISDSGIGIASDKLEAIFEPFVQAESSTTRKFGGTGLGLAISRRFARALGGNIVATSVPDQGSTFHVSLNVGDLRDVTEWLSPAELTRARTNDTSDQAAMTWRFAPATVMVVDDGEENRELVRLVLESCGLTVVEAQDGSVALTQAARHQPALVLMDMQMPVMDGFTATRHLRERGYNKPVLALTANAMKGFETQIEEAGFTGYLTKPVDIDQLLQTLSQFLPGERVPETQRSVAAPAQAVDAPVPANELLSPAAAPRAAPALARSDLEERALDEAALAPSPPTQAPGGPIRSRLESHPRLSRVVRTFGTTLPVKLGLMRQALAADRFAELAELAHWLKGAGGMVGFDCFNDPAKRFEQLAHDNDGPGARVVMAELLALHARLLIPADPAQAEPEPPSTQPSQRQLPVLTEALA